MMFQLLHSLFSLNIVAAKIEVHQSPHTFVVVDAWVHWHYPQLQAPETLAVIFSSLKTNNEKFFRHVFFRVKHLPYLFMRHQTITHSHSTNPYYMLLSKKIHTNVEIDIAPVYFFVTFLIDSSLLLRLLWSLPLAIMDFYFLLKYF